MTFRIHRCVYMLSGNIRAHCSTDGCRRQRWLRWQSATFQLYFFQLAGQFVSLTIIIATVVAATDSVVVVVAVFVTVFALLQLFHFHFALFLFATFFALRIVIGYNSHIVVAICHFRLIQYIVSMWLAFIFSLIPRFKIPIQFAS